MTPAFRETTSSTSGLSSIWAVKSLPQRSSSRSPTKAPWTGALGVATKKPVMGGFSSLRTLAHSSDQKPTGVSSLGAGGSSSPGGASSSPGMGGRSSRSSRAGGCCFFSGAAATKLPLFTCSSRRVSRAFKSFASRLSSGWHSCTMHSSASIRRLDARVKPASVVCKSSIIRINSPLDSFFARSIVSLSEATPESMVIPPPPAVFSTSKSRVKQAISSSMALKSLPSVYSWLNSDSALLVLCSAIYPISSPHLRSPAMPRQAYTRSTVSSPVVAEAHWSSRLRPSRMPPSASLASTLAAPSSRSMLSW